MTRLLLNHGPIAWLIAVGEWVLETKVDPAVCWFANLTDDEDSP